MRFSKLLSTVDSHAAGEPTRAIIGGIPILKGKTIAEKMLYMKANLDFIRKTLMFEPRGHSAMSGAVILEPIHPKADVGVIFIEVGGYHPMCGHDTIGVATILIETGMVEVKEPKTKIVLETPAGLVETCVTVKNGKAIDVTFKNIPSFVFADNLEIDYKGKIINFAIVYGGNVFAMISSDSIGLEIIPENYIKIVTIGNSLKDLINKKYRFIHPEIKFIKEVTHVEFTTHSQNGADAKNAVVFPPGGIDRSPCGTGTCAKLALLYKQKKLSIGDTFIHESIIGTKFKGKIHDVIDYHGYKAVIPEITGSAFLTGFHSFVIDPKDSLKHGFLLGV